MRDAQQRAEEADRIVNNDVWKEVFSDLERDIMNQMLLVKANDTMLHHRLVDSLKVLHSVQRYLENTIVTGRKQRLNLEDDKPGWLRKVV